MWVDGLPQKHRLYLFFVFFFPIVHYLVVFAKTTNHQIVAFTFKHANITLVVILAIQFPYQPTIPCSTYTVTVFPPTEKR